MCRPLKAASLCTKRKARIQIALVFFASFVFNLPRFFQHAIVTEYDEETLTTRVLVNSTAIGYKSTFGVVYHNFLFSVIFVAIPFFVLSVLNVKLILRLRGMDSYNLSIRRGRRRYNEKNITFVMVVIIVACLLCHLPERVVQIVRTILPQPPKSTSYCSSGAMYYVQLASNLLIMTNSSTNFLVYYVFRQKFRQHLVLLCCRRCASDSYIERALRENSRTDRRHSFKPITNIILNNSDERRRHSCPKVSNKRSLRGPPQNMNTFFLPMLLDHAEKQIKTKYSKEYASSFM